MQQLVLGGQGDTLQPKSKEIEAIPSGRRHCQGSGGQCVTQHSSLLWAVPLRPSCQGLLALAEPTLSPAHRVCVHQLQRHAATEVSSLQSPTAKALQSLPPALQHRMHDICAWLQLLEGIYHCHCGGATQQSEASQNAPMGLGVRQFLQCISGEAPERRLELQSCDGRRCTATLRPLAHQAQLG